MAKHHKLMWTGVDIQTALDPEMIRLAVLELSQSRRAGSS